MAHENKTEKATPQKLKKAREQGQVARSRELPSVLAMAAAVAVVIWVAPTSLGRWTALYRNCLDMATQDSFASNGPLLFWNSVEVLRWIFPVLLAAMVISLFAGLAQGGVNFAPKALELQFDRLNPGSRLGQIFSTTALVNMSKSLLPFGAILWIAISTLRGEWVSMVHASGLEMRQLMALVGSMAFALGWKSCLVLIAWSGVDYFLTWMKFQSDLKMTKEEIKEEYKETEGNPLIKSRIRQIQRAMRRAQSLKAAATATVIVTNPTHFAVALKYESDMAAPVVVAKGRDLLAQKIKEIGRDNGVMIIENKPLAQALFKSVEVGDAIPSKLYQAVAELLALVFRAQAELRRQEAERRSRNASGQKIAPSSQLPAGGR